MPSGSTVSSVGTMTVVGKTTIATVYAINYSY